MTMNFQTYRSAARAVAGALALSVLALPALAKDDHAMKRFQAMSNYIDSLKSVQITFDSSIEVVTTDLEKIQFNSSGSLMLQRPDHLRVRRTGGFSDAEFFFDGKTATLTDVTDHRYAAMDMPGTLENLHNKMRKQPGFSLPAADILSQGAFKDLSSSLTDAKTIGPAVIGGELCEHLAFRTTEVDWQLWVHMGDKPYPCKIVINSKTVAGSPQYTVHITSFKADVTFPDGTFDFKAAADGKKVELPALGDIDEIPPESK